MKSVINSLPLSDDLKIQLNNHGQVRAVLSGDYIFNEGEKISEIPILLSGSIRVYKDDTELEREKPLYYIERGDTCMMSVFAIYRDGISRVNGLAVENSEVLFVPVEYVCQWQREFVTWISYLMNSFERRYTDLMDAFDAVNINNVGDQLQAILKRYSENGNTMRLTISPIVLAEELNTTRLVISKLLKQFEKENMLLLHRGEIILKRMPEVSEQA
jgi:CRP/FNR family transcriptional regulator